MAELSIVGFVLGSLSFVVTVRNGIERVLQDADAYKAQIEILVPLSSKLEILSIHLNIWQSFWWINDGTPEELFSSYWGDTGSAEIRRLLAHVHKSFEKVNVEFESKYGHVLPDRTAREPPNRRAYSKENDLESLESLTQFHARRMSRLQRFNIALFTGSLFHKHLESIERSINLLQELSEKRFVEYVCAYRDEDWKSHVEYTAARSHLTLLADRSAIASQALQDLVEASEDHNVDFCLDHGAHPDQRQQKIIEFARECCIPYNFCVSPRHASGMPRLRVQCRETTRSVLSDVAWDQTLRHALRKLCHDENTSNGCCTYVKTAEDAPGFVLTSYHFPEHGLENLRTFMISNRSEYARRLQGEFSRTERTRLAYELAECALLFLRTEWFSGLCSCSIYRLESADLKPVHTVRVNRLSHSDHVDSESGEPCHQTQWCEQELLNMHIRRLGVLLVEIAIGTPVVEVAFNDSKNDVEIDLDARDNETGTTHAAHFQDILRRVRRESSEDFMDAVGYCLKQGTAPRDVVQADLESFYDHVVEPYCPLPHPSLPYTDKTRLLVRYNEEIVQPAFRRGRRKRAREDRLRG
ncbi:MAG: hypothetical protein LQ338_004447 [Usnochroma carphineum]|nr:MAG: hypothetical protein LQ338_004447 [Usnochroma carphineum]